MIKYSQKLFIEFKKKAVWYTAFIFILCIGVWGLNISSERINYQWNWNRVPKYFFYDGAVDQYAEQDGVVRVKRLSPEASDVKVEYKNGETASFEISNDSLTVYDNAEVKKNDKLGAVKSFNKGILITGLITTLEISLYAGVLSIFIGLFAGLGRISKNPLFKGVTTLYVEIIRGTPLLVQIFIFYFFIGTILEFSRFTAGCLSLAFFAGAYVAEIIRSGIQSIHPGQMEAARSLGMNYVQAMCHIILPQALKRTLPPLAGQFISLIKDSSLVSVIAITDLTKAGREVITSTFATFEIWFTVAGMYLVMTLALSMFVRYLEKRKKAND